MDVLRKFFLMIALLAAAVPPAGAGGWLEGWEFFGDTGVGARWFPEEGRWLGQSDGLGASLVVNGEARWRGESMRASFKPFVRLDSRDAKRSQFDLREAYWAWEGDGWELLAGANKVFWGVAESRHLVDIVNQTDGAADPDQEQKLGQPMVRALLQRDWGQLEAYVMPVFREQTFPGREGRLRTPLPVDTERPVYESDAGEYRTDLAVRWSHFFGELDIGAYAFHGTGREPKLVPAEDGAQLQPYYHVISQLGIDAQYTRDAWLWKLEAIHRRGLNDTFFAAVAGMEYTLYSVGDTSLDAGLLLEYLHDGRAASEPQTVFDDDMFLGVRLAWNDASDTTLLMGLVADRRASERFFNLEAERRFGEYLFGELRLRLFEGDDDVAGLGVFEQDDYVEVMLTRYF